jgi:paraquat-inducible protein B
MSKKANPTFIGLFIIIGLALGVIGLLLFSSSKLFSPSVECVLYFNDSLNGLSEGAPVKYRGVTIGSVKRVMIRFNQATNDYAMPVIIELEKKLMEQRLGEPVEVFTKHSLRERVERGMRASLQAESLVTGVLYIEVRPNPNAPPPVYHQLVKRYPELPTEPTQIQQLMSNLASLDIKGIETNLIALITQLDTAVGNLHLAEVGRNLTNDLASVRATLDEYRLLGEKLNRGIDPLLDTVTNSLVEAGRALVQIRGAAENLRTIIRPDSPLSNDLDQALQQLAAATQSLSVLLDFLKENPNALITGRQILEKKP